VSVKELISKLNPAVTIYEVARKAKCSHCDTKGVADFRLLYMCGTREEVWCVELKQLYYFAAALKTCLRKK